NGTTVATHTMTQNFPSLVGDMVMYDEGTQISSLNLYATTIDKSLQKVDYAYNVRGWLTDINDINDNSKERDLFNFHINYDSKDGMTATGSITPLYNGNISQTMWKTANTDNQIRAYGYAYDDLNRINSGFSRRGTNFDTVDSYSLINVSYDKNGNIGGLERRGLGSGTEVMDDLTYTYDGNQLLSVTDLSANTSSSISNQGFYDGNTSGDDFEYDVNGNMIKDRNKGITDNIEYNHLNLPEIVKINTTDPYGFTQQGTITYIYDAVGTKLAKIVNDEIQNSTITTYYAGRYIYENNNNYESLKMFSHPEGYVEPVYGTTKSIQKFSNKTQTTSFSSYQYAFNFTDHLGNVRLTYADSDGDGAIAPSSEIISEKHYYPLGLQQKGYNNTVTSNSNSIAEQFAYNGKENNPEFGLDWYDFGARLYQPETGRWFTTDAFAEMYYDQSSYNYVLNNPIYYFDPDGNVVKACCNWEKIASAFKIGIGASAGVGLKAKVTKYASAGVSAVLGEADYSVNDDLLTVRIFGLKGNLTIGGKDFIDSKGDVTVATLEIRGLRTIFSDEDLNVETKSFTFIRAGGKAKIFKLVNAKGEAYLIKYDEEEGWTGLEANGDADIELDRVFENSDVAAELKFGIKLKAGINFTELWEGLTEPDPASTYSPIPPEETNNETTNEVCSDCEGKQAESIEEEKSSSIDPSKKQG
ncbi:RHS repeat domain-containing protein, partial [Dokdonia pacifica]